jgi:hypothetical protein
MQIISTVLIRLLHHTDEVSVNQPLNPVNLGAQVMPLAKITAEGAS